MTSEKRNEMVTNKMNWSGPNVIHFGRKSRFGPDQFILVVTISFWSRPNHYGQVQINLVRPKPFWIDQNCFGHIEGQGISFIHANTILGRISSEVTISFLLVCNMKPTRESFLLQVQENT